ncbi:MAG: type I DNA topoisomerase [Promethearchaeota archaeon]|jgi:DNA topoisomerase-1
MSKGLVIIESPGKITSYKKALGSDYTIAASYGHCVDLPAKGLSINIKKNFEPTWDINPDKHEVVTYLKKAAKSASAIYLMSDEDREGEAIAWHLKRVLEKSTKAPFHRASTNEITKTGIKKALQNPGDINLKMIDAYLCRRLLDRLCGYKTSFLTQQATGGRSAGRVQSAMLRVLTEREKEIKHFVPEEYWILTAHFLSSQKAAYIGVLDEKIKVPNDKVATEIYQKVVKGKPVVASVDTQDVSVTPYAPFTTSTLIQASSTVFGWPAHKTMQVAQGLYEAGHITYMRTDSPSMAKEAVTTVRELVDHEYGTDYLHSTPRVYTAKKGSQEGHECCRPTEILSQSVSGSADAQNMYGMIWKRAIASQMAAGKDRRVKAVTKIGGYDFVSRGNTRLFDGFRKVWTYGKQQENLLPDLKKGEKCTLTQLDKEQKWTTPPPRYSDASLQKKCDSAQITRPATFASFLKTLENRGYITRTKKSFEATDLGIRVVDFLTEAKMCFVDLKFTAEMEQLLDEVASGSKDKTKVLKDFWDTLKSNIENGKKVRDELSKTDYECPKCPGKLRRKHSKFGAFYSCENYKKEGGCSYVAKIGDDGKPIEKVVQAKEYAPFVCELCSSKMVKRKSKYGEFYGCETYPSCYAVADLVGTFKKSKKAKKSKKKKKSKKGKKSGKSTE